MSGLTLLDALAEARCYGALVGANSFAHGARSPRGVRINPALDVTSPEPAGYL